ncbi:MAG: ABC transporter permease, partial [Acidobacteria bacterium]|nr:ABC transporter permease [Acidobacteriota bacterium]
VADAALALTASGVDAICQIPGNLTVSAFPSIAHAARQTHLPIFVFQSGQVRGGAVIAVARDYYDSGREAAALAARIMRGENPGSIPFVPFAKTRLIVNQEAARQRGLVIPRSIVGSADEIVGK